MVQNKNKFVKVGFEFTATAKASSRVTNPNLIYGTSWLFDTDVLSTTDNWKKDKSEYPWIIKNFESDECGCEIPTPIIRSRPDVEKYYLQFMDFVKRSNLTTDINNAKNGLGGCHIHLDLSYLDKDVKILFLKNIGIFMSNNPWLNWALNDPNDNINANSLVNSFSFNNIQESVALAPDRKSKKFKNAKTPLEFFMIDPLNTMMKKMFAVRYNFCFDTIEFRIFNMPISQEEHLFHYNVAMAIYNYCLKLTLEKKALKLIIQDYHNYFFLDRNFVNLFLKTTLGVIGLSLTHEQLDKMLYNIETRYKWSHTDKTLNRGTVSTEDFYLF